ncbi:MAG: endopeptidase La [Planctomycetota bacterium]
MVEIVEPDSEEQAAAQESETAVSRKERLPEKLFIVPLPNIVIYPDLMVPLVLQPGRAQETIEPASARSPLAGFVCARAEPSDGLRGDGSRGHSSRGHGSGWEAAMRGGEKGAGEPGERETGGREAGETRAEEPELEERAQEGRSREGWAHERFGPAQLYPMGTVARLVRKVRLPDGNLQLVIQGIQRFRIEKFLRVTPYLIARVTYPEEILTGGDEELALIRNIQGMVREIVKHSPIHGEEFGTAILNIEGGRAISDFVAAYFIKDPSEREALLETLDVTERLNKVAMTLTREVELLKLGSKIQAQMQERLEKSQREFFLREQVKAIRRELGEDLDERAVELENYEHRMAEAGLPEVVLARAKEELRKLSKMSPESAESAVARNYLDWLLAVPWSRSTPDSIDIAQAERILERDHYGLKEIKERILEFLAVRQLRPQHKGSILCFTGPPGVGKTSLGRSIAEALGRKFVRMSVGGMRDEAEIRGHRRTYVGALPGRIVQGLKTAGSSNPVFMLDEIDKVGSDFRGDPSSALLEVLDPEQNATFADHYLELPLDLSRVLFITTANQVDTIARPLLDRMEVISINGYILEEKVQIARRYLLRRQIENHGLVKGQLSLSLPALRSIVQDYTREAGVRALEKCLARICRKVATRVARGRRAPCQVRPENLRDYLGVSHRADELSGRVKRPGVAVGLAWTPTGGEVLFVEALKIPGAGGQIQLTGMLGDVMLESARIAYSFVKANLDTFGIAADALKKNDIHLHVPAGAIPKDGPSAGITMATAMTSLLIHRPVRANVAMTGELTLTGKVLPIGGVRDKILAARRARLREILLPVANRPDVEEIPGDLLRGLELHYVDTYADVYARVFGKGSGCRELEVKKQREPAKRK